MEIRETWPFFSGEKKYFFYNWHFPPNNTNYWYAGNAMLQNKEKKKKKNQCEFYSIKFFFITSKARLWNFEGIK